MRNGLGGALVRRTRGFPHLGAWHHTLRVLEGLRDPTSCENMVFMLRVAGDVHVPGLPVLSCWVNEGGE